MALLAVPDTSSWASVGRTSNVRYFAVEPGVLAGIADEGSSDDAETASENAAFHNRYFREHGPGVVLIFPETGVSQDKAARQVYQHSWDTSVCLGAGFVGASLLVRAMAALLLGFTRLQTPFKLFDSLPEALGWARELLAKHAAAASSTPTKET